MFVVLYVGVMMKFKGLFFIIVFLTIVILAQTSFATDSHSLDSDNINSTYVLTISNDEEVEINNSSILNNDSERDLSEFNYGIKSGQESEKYNLSLYDESQLNPTENNTGCELDNISNISISYSSLGDDLNNNILNLNYSNQNTIFVNSSYVGSLSDGTYQKPYTSINKKVFADLQNKEYDNLFIANGEYFLSDVIELIGSGYRAINIVGESSSNTIINGGANITSFKIGTQLSVRFINLTFYNAFSSEYALIHAVYDSEIYLNNVIFKDNFCESPGGIIYSDKGNLYINNVSIYNNTIDYDTGLYGGIICNLGGNLTITNSNFSNNIVSANTSSGAVIYTSTSSLLDRFSLINSTIDTNIISNSTIKGPIIFSKGYVLSNITGSNITNNYINGSSSLDIILIDGFTYYENVVIENNTVKNVINYTDLALIYNPLVVNNAFDLDSLNNVNDLNLNSSNYSGLFPSSYDLRNVNGTSYLTSVKNQESYNTCWAFATYASLESYLLMYENITYDFSEANMAKVMSKLNRFNGSLWSVEDGGNYMLALAYLLRWSGAVNESDDPYSNMGSNLLPNLDLNIAKHIQSIEYIPYRLNYLDNDQIKYAVMHYGGVVTSIYMLSSKNIYSSSYNRCNHAITIIGWDDNYSASNFRNTPPGNGAFIIKNSWGEKAGDSGYYYVSYYDASLGMSDSCFGFVFTEVEDADNYENIYQYDIYGNTNVAVGYLSDTAWFANQFTIVDNNPIASFGMYTYGDSNYTAIVYINGKEAYSQNGTVSGPGYHTIKFNNLINVSKGDLFRINIGIKTPNCLYPIAIESSRGGFVNTSSKLNQSFVSRNGINWYDLNNLYSSVSPNVCIKLYSGRNLTVDAVSNVSSYVNGDLIYINLTVDNYLNLASTNISFTNYDAFEFISFDVNCGRFDNETKTWILENLNHNDFALLNLVLKVNSKGSVSFLNFNIISPSYDINDECSLEFINSNYSVLINGSDFNTSYVNHDFYVVNLISLSNTAIENINLTFDIYDNDGKFVRSYSDLTDSKGYAKFLIDLDVGNYEVRIDVSNSSVACLEISRTISVFRTPIHTNASSMSFDYGSNGYYVAYILDNFNKPISGVNVGFELSDEKGYSYGTYYSLTDLNGRARFLVKLNASSYNVRISVLNSSFDFSEINNIITVSKSRVAVNFSDNWVYYKDDDSLYIKLIDTKYSKVLSNELIHVCIADVNGTVYNKTLITDSKGFVNLSMGSYIPGSYNIDVSSSNSNFYLVNNSFTFKVLKSSAIISANAISSYYNSGAYFKIKLVDNNTNKVLSGVKLKILIYTGDNYKTVYLTTDSNGMAQLKVNGLSVGSHKVYITSDDSYVSTTKLKSTIKISAIPTKVSAPSISAKYKSSKYLKINVKNSKTLKLVSNLKLKLRIYTGKKYKTVYVKTNSKGIASYKVKYLARGNHKVLIRSANSNYSVKLTSYIKIK